MTQFFSEGESPTYTKNISALFLKILSAQINREINFLRFNFLLLEAFLQECKTTKFMVIFCIKY